MYMLNCFSHVRLFATLWTAAHEAPLSMGFSRQEYWSWLPCPPPGDLPDPGIEPKSYFSGIGRRILYHQCHLESPFSNNECKSSFLLYNWASQATLVVKNPPANIGDIRVMALIPGSGRSSGGGHGNPLQCSCLESPIDRGAWQATVHGVMKSQTQLKRPSMRSRSDSRL